MVFKKGIITDVSGDTFHLRQDAGEDIWFKATPMSIGAGLVVGDNVEVLLHSPATIGEDVGLLSACQIRKLGPLGIAISDDDTDYVTLRPVALTVEHDLPKGQPSLHFDGPAYASKTKHKDCTGRLKFLPCSGDAIHPRFISWPEVPGMAQIPETSIGWGNMATQSGGMFDFVIIYEPEHEARVLGLRNLALAEDTKIKLHVQAIGDGGVVAVLSCEVNQDYRLPSQFDAERGF